MVASRTAEVRWFREGPPPQAVVDWFVGGGLSTEAERVRVDRYLWVPRLDSLGIKFREGRIEVKRRQGPGRAVQLAPTAAGMLEVWDKWAFGLAEAASAEEDLGGQAAWVGVKKARLVRVYAVTPDDAVVPIPATASYERGCSVELAQVTAADRFWWSFSFEAVSDGPLLDETLRATAGHVLVEPCEMLRLDLEASYGYPRWLQVAGPYFIM